MRKNCPHRINEKGIWKCRILGGISCGKIMECPQKKSFKEYLKEEIKK